MVDLPGMVPCLELRRWLSTSSMPSQKFYFLYPKICFCIHDDALIRLGSNSKGPYDVILPDLLHNANKLNDSSQCHDTLVQYGTFLATNLTKSEYADNFPTLAELIRVYNIPFETSIFLLRSVYWNEISVRNSQSNHMPQSLFTFFINIFPISKEFSSRNSVSYLITLFFLIPNFFQDFFPNFF